MPGRCVTLFALALFACGGEPYEGGFTVVVVSRRAAPERAELGAVESRVVIRNVDSGRCLDVPHQTAGSPALVWTWECNRTIAQTWELRRNGDGYVLSSAASGKCLDVPYSSSGSVVTLSPFDPYASRAQEWALEATTSGSYLVRSRASGMCLGIPPGQAIGVKQYPCHGGDGQRWELTEAQ